jgi:hypothetical protein
MAESVMMKQGSGLKKMGAWMEIEWAIRDGTLDGGTTREDSCLFFLSRSRLDGRQLGAPETKSGACRAVSDVSSKVGG